MPATYESIATTTLTGNQANIEFTSISGSYTDLVAIIQAKSTNNDTYDIIKVQVGNGSADTGSNYSYSRMYGNGSSAISGRASNISDMSIACDAAQNSDFGRMHIMNFMNYSNTTTYKTIIHRGQGAIENAMHQVFLWRSTSAINTIKFSLVYGANMISGTRITLYGIKAA